MLPYGKSITCQGYVYDGKAEINYCEIKSELIKAAGTFCENYASDVYYDLQNLENCVTELRSQLIFIGIRDWGVDGYSFVKCRLENPSTYGINNYIRLYRLETWMPDDRTYMMELRRVDEYDAKKEILENEEA